MKYIVIFLILLFSFSYSEERDTKAITKEVSAYVKHHVTDSDHLNLYSIIHFDMSSLHRDVEIMGRTFDLGPTVHLVFLTLNTLILLLVFTFFGQPKSADGAPRGFSNVVEVMVNFIYKDVCIQNMGEKEGERFAPFFLTMFVLILFSNYVGIIPGLHTPTGNVNFTAAMALMIFYLMIHLGIKHLGIVGFAKSFFPSGLPLFFRIILGPFLYFLEFLSLFTRPFALTLRLFANMLAGHMMLMFMIGFIIIYAVKGLPMILVVLFIYALKVLVCFLQAYIFVLLSSIYLGMVMNPHHD